MVTRQKFRNKETWKATQKERQIVCKDRYPDSGLLVSNTGCLEMGKKYLQRTEGKTCQPRIPHGALLLFKMEGGKCTIRTWKSWGLEIHRCSLKGLQKASLGETSESSRKERAAGSNHELRNRYESVRSKSLWPGAGSHLGRRDWWGWIWKRGYNSSGSNIIFHLVSKHHHL